ncbi:MAG TPA: aldo/keto reductase, partial [Streptosporangiaceae bacterium]
MTVIPQIMLNNGQEIPQLGFGVFLVPPKETFAAVTSALEAGYRHVDTAQAYGNEAEVGAAISKFGVDRANVFITTKLNNGAHRPDDARAAFDGSLRALGSDYVDLFLIHWPLPTRYDGDFVSTWRTLEEFYRDGRARSIGVSNFQPHHLRRIHQEGG